MTEYLSRRRFLTSSAAGAAGLSLAHGARGQGGSGGRPKPNIVIILADDMGYGFSHVYDGWIRTPHLERLAAEGITFTDFHSSGSVCSPTRAGLMTGRYQERAGIPGVIVATPKRPAHRLGLLQSETTFPELLKGAGYTSAIFGKWHLGYTERYNPLNHGFDRFRGFLAGNIDYISHRSNQNEPDWMEGREQIEEEGYLTHLLTEHAVEFVRENKQRPFCLYLSHGAVHTPLQGPGDPPQRGPGAQKFDKSKTEETCRRMMEELDRSVGDVVAAVEEAGIAEDTLVFFFSDNGAPGNFPNGSGPLRGSKGTLWEGGHRVPAIASWPGRIKPGVTTDDACISLDLMPTMLEMAGVEAPREPALDGASLLPLLERGEGFGERRLFWQGRAMREGRWKLIDAKGGAELYDLAEDLGEERNLAEEEAERVEAMLAEVRAHRREIEAEGAEKMRAMGVEAEEA